MAHPSPPPPPPPPPLPPPLLLQPNVAPDLHLCPPLIHIAIATIVRGCTSINAGRGAGSRAVGHLLFCGLIRVDGKHPRWPGALSDPSPKGLGNIFDVGNEQPIPIDGADLNADLAAEV
jgi:hypothetical protein